jgi:GNAT superfamily N-acetyltransferase
MRFRFALPSDAELLAPLNAQLIRDEGHRNRMSIPQLAERMRGWLSGEYRAVVFDDDDGVVGYALFRHEPEHIYLRQFFVRPESRRHGIGRTALLWLRRNAWGPDARVRVDVLVGNELGQVFWRAVGFNEYCVTLEQESTSAP